MQTSPESDVAYFEPKERRQPVMTRLPESLKEDLEDVSELWSDINQSIAALQGEKKFDSVSLNEVIVRLLRIGVDGVWGENGGKPKSKADRDVLVKKLAALYVPKK